MLVSCCLLELSHLIYFHINVPFSLPVQSVNQYMFYKGIFFGGKLYNGTKIFNTSYSVDEKLSLTPHQVKPLIKSS